MEKKKGPTYRPTPALRFVSSPITDPKDLEETKQAIRYYRRIQRFRDALAEHPVEDRLKVVARLLPLLAPEDQVEQVFEILKLAPEEVVLELEHEILGSTDTTPTSENGKE